MLPVMVPVPEIGPEDALESVLKYSIGRSGMKKKGFTTAQINKNWGIVKKVYRFNKG
jgi:hypothetical protein